MQVAADSSRAAAPTRPAGRSLEALDKEMSATVILQRGRKPRVLADTAEVKGGGAKRKAKDVAADTQDVRGAAHAGPGENGVDAGTAEEAGGKGKKKKKKKKDREKKKVEETPEEAAAIARANLSRVPSRASRAPNDNLHRDAFGGPKPPSPTAPDPLLALAADLQLAPGELYHDYDKDHDFLPLKGTESSVDLDLDLDVDDDKLSAAADLVSSSKRRMTVVQQEAFHSNVDAERRKSELSKALPEMQRVDSLALFDAALTTVAEGSKRLSIHRRKTVEAVMEKADKNKTRDVQEDEEGGARWRQHTKRT